MSEQDEQQQPAGEAPAAVVQAQPATASAAVPAAAPDPECED